LTGDGRAPLSGRSYPTQHGGDRRSQNIAFKVESHNHKPQINYLCEKRVNQIITFDEEFYYRFNIYIDDVMRYLNLPKQAA
jgi:hypothetical protein